MAITKVWIEEGCTECGICEDSCPEVFKILDEVTIIEGVNYADYEMGIKKAADKCPVEVIRYIRFKSCGTEYNSHKSNIQLYDRVMETEKELNSEIMKITLKIQEEYPELYEFLGEMPDTIPDMINPEINIKNLREYQESLTSLLENYKQGHAKEDSK